MDMIFSYQRNGDFSETMYYDCLVEEGAEQEQERFLRTCLPLSGTIPDYDPRADSSIREKQISRLTNEELLTDAVYDELSRIAEIETDSVFNKTYDLLEKSIIGRDEIKLEDELNEMGFGE